MSLNHIVAGTSTPLALECKSLDADDITTTAFTASSLAAGSITAATATINQFFSSMLVLRTCLKFGAKISAANQYFIGNGAVNAVPFAGVPDNSVQQTVPAHMRLVRMVVTGATGVTGADVITLYVNGAPVIVQGLTSRVFTYLSPPPEVLTGDIITVQVTAKTATFDDTGVDLYFVEAS